MKRIEPWVLPVFGLILCIVLVITCPCSPGIASVLKLNARNEQLAFTPEGWNGPMEDSNGFTGTRLKMVDDLLKRYDFHGWSVAEVKQLLGKSDWDEIDQGQHLVEYDLRDGLNLLIFHVDDREHVLSYEVRRED